MKLSQNPCQRLGFTTIRPWKCRQSRAFLSIAGDPVPDRFLWDSTYLQCFPCKLGCYIASSGRFDAKYLPKGLFEQQKRGGALQPRLLSLESGNYWLLGAIGSASDSRSEGWVFESLRGQNFCFFSQVKIGVNSLFCQIYARYTAACLAFRYSAACLVS